MTVDLKREIPSYRARRGEIALVTVPPLQYLMVDGHGDPNTAPEYQDALRTLYPVAYTLKFLSRRELGRDHVVMPLEALWWSDDMAAFTTSRDKSRWSWTAMILVPDWIAAEHVEDARARVAAKGGAPVLDALRLERLDEGLCVQTLHVGPYDAEGPVLAEIHDRFVPDHGLRMTGRHHEVYLSDARRTAPERLRTILRQPVVRDDA
ncbi:GyrI-like domain-containing protein [Cellulomonas telluris]|uniref:GyrI-like domain-containing protein n=1 Tax=Cellulomonas telluris TaxID=2306636 RepID=UPI0010A811DF|nr:GyrI-like domain-containing protein [Cellulomonas telluris]